MYPVDIARRLRRRGRAEVRSQGFDFCRDVVCVFGPPGAGKSVIVPHIAYDIAQNRPVFGRRTREGPVLYLAAEDPHGMRQRVRCLRLPHGDANRLNLVEGLNSLLDPADETALRNAVKSIKPALVCIDTVSLAFPGIDENA